MDRVENSYNTRLSKCVINMKYRNIAIIYIYLHISREVYFHQLTSSCNIHMLQSGATPSAYGFKSTFQKFVFA